MEKKTFKDIEDLAQYMCEESRDGKYIVAALFYAEAIQLLKELLLYDFVHAEYINIEPDDWNGYNKEYYVSLSNEEAGLILDIEPAFAEYKGKYLGISGNIILIDGKASSNLLKCLINHDWIPIDLKDCYEIKIGDSAEPDDEEPDEPDDIYKELAERLARLMKEIYTS